MKKIIFLLVLCIGSVLFSCNTEPISDARFYERLVKHKKIGIVREYSTKELNEQPEILETRGDDLIIERCIGKVINKRKDGRIINTDDPYYNYISYKGVREAKKGDIIMTLFVYNPGNSYCDDIVDRFDYIIDKQK